MTWRDRTILALELSAVALSLAIELVRYWRQA